MEGELSLGTKQDPKYQPMRAKQILAAPHGLLWRVSAGNGAMRLSGSDGMVADRSWTRFWLLGLVPVVRAIRGAGHPLSGVESGHPKHGETIRVKVNNTAMPGAYAFFAGRRTELGRSSRANAVVRNR